MNRIIAYGLCGIAVTLLSAHAAVVVNPPLSITHRVTIQATIVATDTGLDDATAFGSPTQQTSILNSIRSIREYASRGILPYFQLGRHKLFKKEEILIELRRSRHGSAWHLLR